MVKKDSAFSVCVCVICNSYFCLSEFFLSPSHCYPVLSWSYMVVLWLFSEVTQFIWCLCSSHEVCKTLNGLRPIFFSVRRRNICPDNLACQTHAGFHTIMTHNFSYYRRCCRRKIFLLWGKPFFLFCFYEDQTDHFNSKSFTQRISQRLIQKPMLIYAPKHKSYSVVHYFANPPCHSIDVSVQHFLL